MHATTKRHKGGPPPPDATLSVSCCPAYRLPASPSGERLSPFLVAVFQDGTRCSPLYSRSLNRRFFSSFPLLASILLTPEKKNNLLAAHC